MAARKGGAGGNREEMMLKRFDKDGDGKLSEAEKAEAEKAMAARKGGAGGNIPAEALKRFDKDGDGKLSEAEKAEAQKSRKGAQALLALAAEIN